MRLVPGRRGLLTIHLEAVDHAITTKREEAVGQFDLFGDLDEADAGPGFGPALVVAIEEWDKPVLLSYEREMLGLYVSDNPLLGVEHVLATLVDASIAGLADPAAPSPQARTAAARALPRARVRATAALPVGESGRPAGDPSPAAGRP